MVFVDLHYRSRRPRCSMGTSHGRLPLHPPEFGVHFRAKGARKPASSSGSSPSMHERGSVMRCRVANFEPDHKQDWPTYVKLADLRRVPALAQLEPTPTREANLATQVGVSAAFALDDSERVTRYIKMVEVADQFEDYHVNEKTGRVRGQAFRQKRFEYFRRARQGDRAGRCCSHSRSDEPLRRLGLRSAVPGEVP